LVRHRVVRVIFEGTRAVGIEYIDDTIGREKGTTETLVARASRLVVLSAGAFGSPSILERSGIGSKDVLTRNNVQQLVDLPGVGENYLDHNLAVLPFIASDGADSMEQVFCGTEEEMEPHEKRWLHDGQGLMASNGCDAGIKMRPTNEELSSMSPEFDHRWSTYFANAPDKPVAGTTVFRSRAGQAASRTNKLLQHSVLLCVSCLCGTCSHYLWTGPLW